MLGPVHTQAVGPAKRGDNLVRDLRQLGIGGDVTGRARERVVERGFLGGEAELLVAVATPSRVCISNTDETE